MAMGPSADLMKKERLCTFVSGHGDELRYFFFTKCLLGLNCLFYRNIIFSFNVNRKITDCVWIPCS
jgi:hypothetical protein